jgi:lipopolysaccharide export system permease protein
LLQRYVFREIAFPLAAWLLLIITLMWVMAVLKGTDVLLGSQVTLADFARVSAYLLPHFIVQAAPIAYLLGLLTGLGRLSEDNELVAMQACGVAPRRMWVAPLVLAALVSAGLCALAFGAQPSGLQAAQRLAQEIIKRNLVGDVKPGVFQSQLQAVTLYVERVEAPGRWGNVLVYDERVPSSPVLLLAEAGQVSDAPEGAPLTLVLSNGRLYRTDEEDDARLHFETATLSLGIEEAVRQKNRFRAIRDELTPLELFNAARTEDAETAQRFSVAAHWKLGQVLMPLSFALLGVPLALSRRTSGRARGVMLTLAGYAAFYVLAQVSTSFGEKGVLPALIAGLAPNLVFLALGLLARRLIDRRGLAR